MPTFWQQVFVNCEYDFPELSPSASTIVDLGANIGLATLYFAARYPQASILAVEPAAENFNVLLRKTQSLGLRVHRYQAAVWTLMEKSACEQRTTQIIHWVHGASR